MADLITSAITLKTVTTTGRSAAMIGISRPAIVEIRGMMAPRIFPKMLTTGGSIEEISSVMIGASWEIRVAASWMIVPIIGSSTGIS